MHFFHYACRTLAIMITLSIIFLSAARAQTNDNNIHPMMVSDIRTAAILSGNQIDAPIDPELFGHLLLISIGIDTIEQHLMDPLALVNEKNMPDLTLKEALRLVADDKDKNMDAYIQLAASLVENPKVFNQQFLRFKKMAGLKATSIKIGIDDTGAPTFSGHTTLRDMVRLATSLSRAYEPSIRSIFDLATGKKDAALIWMFDEKTCLLVGTTPRTKRLVAAAASGISNVQTCFKTTAQLLTDQDKRLQKISSH